MIITGSLLISAKGILAKLLYAEGMASDELVTIRAILALPLFWAWAIWRVGLINLFRVNRRALLGSVVAGIACYYLGARLNFYSLTLIDASLERVLLYTYPTLVVIATALIQKRVPEWRMIVALIMTYLGVLLAVGGFRGDLFQTNLFGTGLVMFCALTFAFYFIINDRVRNHISSAAFTVYAMTAATVALSLHFFIENPVNTFTFTLNARAWQLLLFMVLFVTVIPVFMIAESVRRIGAQRAALISTVGPPSTIILATLILDESMLLGQLGGVLFILVGLVLLEMRQHARSTIS
ncbi:MAG: DMT family transporter [Proteobacteria bacterium]|nr:DMT family transporter [Pseudomonadota bacterium]